MRYFNHTLLTNCIGKVEYQTERFYSDWPKRPVFPTNILMFSCPYDNNQGLGDQIEWIQTKLRRTADDRDDDGKRIL
jgi:hypothetical protein